MLTIWSKAHEMKSPNCISSTGRIPSIAAPIAGADDQRLRNRRVDHAVFAEGIEQPFGNLERAAQFADVLAHHEDVVVAAHLFMQRLVDRFQIGDFHRAPAVEVRARYRLRAAGQEPRWLPLPPPVVDGVFVEEGEGA